jgi:hypothetical protein
MPFANAIPTRATPSQTAWPWRPSTPQQKHFTIPLHTVPGAHYPSENVTTWSMPCHGICLLRVQCSPVSCC